MDKIPFPYTKSNRMYYWNHSLPLGEFCRIYQDLFLHENRYPFSLLGDIPLESKMRSMELISFQLAVSLNVMVAGMERALERLDTEMYRLLNGKSNFNWPKPKQGWPEIPTQKPFEFFYYDLDKVINHWKNIFSIDLRPLNFDQICDFVQFRHVWSHSAGFVNASGSKKFKYYKVDTNRTLLPSSLLKNSK